MLEYCKPKRNWTQCLGENSFDKQGVLWFVKETNVEKI